MTRFLFLFLLPFLITINPKTNLPDSKRASDVRAAVWPRLQKELSNDGSKKMPPIYLRIFKDQDQLEIWVRSGSTYRLFKSYEICYYSGNLGTKTRSGDGKSPEGFYTIEPGQLNPVSNYHLAINIGYPNKVERLKGYTGNAVMIHGRCASIGCYAMTDARIEEIFTLVYKAFENGQQKINLDIFPFRMDKAHMDFYSRHPSFTFWKTLQHGYNLFEKNHVPTDYHIKGKEYAF